MCRGNGTTVSPSIDAGGLTEEDRYDWSPEDYDNYFGGAYDVTCPECHGKRVVPEIQTGNLNEVEKTIYEAYQRDLADEWDYAMTCAAERRMGA